MNILLEGQIFTTNFDGEINVFIIQNGVPVEYSEHEEISITEKERDYICKLMLETGVVSISNMSLLEKLLKMFK